MADDLAALLEEQQRRQGQVTGGYKSVLAGPEETTTLKEVQKFTESLLKGSTKGIIDTIGGWGRLYDYIKENKDPSALSGQGIVNAIANLGGPDLMKIQGYKGAYTLGETGAPAALMGRMVPSTSLFTGTGKVISTPARAAAAEFGVAGGTGLLSQTVAPESPYGQAAMQSLPYMLAGGISGIKAKKTQSLLKEYEGNLPTQDANIFNKYILKGQTSSDPVIAADIARLQRDPKFLELITTLNEGASAKALEGMTPKTSKLSAEQSKVGIIQAIQNKLDGLREHNADSLFEKAKGYGAGQGLVDPTITLGKIDGLINRYSAMTTPNAERAVQVLNDIRERLQPTKEAMYGAQPSSTFTVREGTPGFTTPNQPGGVRIVERQVPTFDSLGTPTGMKTVREEVPFSGVQGVSVAGTPATIGTRPSSTGTKVNWQTAPEKLTIEQVQGMLSEFGKKASAGDSLIKDLSISDERVISSAIFGGIKDDMAAAIKGSTGKDQAALRILDEARDRVSKASTAYNEAVSQGLPAYLRDKSLASIAPEELFQEYSRLTPSQRASMRSLVGDTNQAALDFIDNQVFNDFVNKAKKPNALGVETVDLKSLADNWRGLNATDKDALTTALGINASDFARRMQDAELFTRKMSVGQTAQDQLFSNPTVRETQAAVGGVAGYAPAKMVQLGMDTLNSLTTTGLTNDQLMKILLTDQGADFLKNAAMSPRSQKTLESLTATEQATPASKWIPAQAARMGARIGTTEQPTEQQTQQVAPQEDLQMLLEEQARRQQQGQ